MSTDVNAVISRFWRRSRRFIYVRSSAGLPVEVRPRLSTSPDLLRLKAGRSSHVPLIVVGPATDETFADIVIDLDGLEPTIVKAETGDYVSGNNTAESVVEGRVSQAHLLEVLRHRRCSGTSTRPLSRGICRLRSLSDYGVNEETFWREVTRSPTTTGSEDWIRFEGHLGTLTHILRYTEEGIFGGLSMPNSENLWFSDPFLRRTTGFCQG